MRFVIVLFFVWTLGAGIPVLRLERIGNGFGSIFDSGLNGPSNTVLLLEVDATGKILFRDGFNSNACIGEYIITKTCMRKFLRVFKKNVYQVKRLNMIVSDADYYRLSFRDSAGECIVCTNYPPIGVESSEFWGQSTRLDHLALQWRNMFISVENIIKTCE